MTQCLYRAAYVDLKLMGSLVQSSSQLAELFQIHFLWDSHGFKPSCKSWIKSGEALMDHHHHHQQQGSSASVIMDHHHHHHHGDICYGFTIQGKSSVYQHLAEHIVNFSISVERANTKKVASDGVVFRQTPRLTCRKFLQKGFGILEHKGSIMLKVF